MKFFVKMMAVAMLLAGLTACAEKREEVTLRYANWNVGTEEENNIQRQLVAAYVAANPNVTVEFVDMSGMGWDDKLTALAAAGELPDVFMANNVPNYVKNGWLADVSSLVKSDKDWAKVSDALKAMFTYNTAVYGLPAAQFIMGYWVNKDLYDAANLDVPEYGISASDWEQSVIDLTDIENGVMGLDEQEFVAGWYGNTINSDLKWFSFDGMHMNYDSQAFKNAVNKAISLKPYTWQGLNPEQQAAIGGPWEFAAKGKYGLRWDASWSYGYFAETATFDFDFVGIPGGTQALVADVMVVSKDTANLKESYRFAKWMSFSVAAYAEEVKLVKAAGTGAPKMPVAIDTASLDLYKEFIGSKPGILAALNNLDNSLVESLAKAIPGYVEARWTAKPGIAYEGRDDASIGDVLYDVINGTVSLADYSNQLQTFANTTLDDAKAALGLE